MKKTHIAFLWDESYLWGIMAYNVLKGLSIPFDLITANDINSGILDNYRLLFVPGGWASDKTMALGDGGKDPIRMFVKSGGNYLGICGGAGMALMERDGLGLLPVKRRSTKDRIPSFSGQVRLKRTALQHPIWNGLPEPTVFHAWWPSQFEIVDNAAVITIADYGEPEDNAYVADLKIAGVKSDDWKRWEMIYGINLNPSMLKGEPAIIEGRYEKGNVILSMLHFDTPDDIYGQRALENLLVYLTYPGNSSKISDRINAISPSQGGAKANEDNHRLFSRATEMSPMAELEELIDFGIKNNLWFRRNPWLLQWQRGIRGLEYNTLYILIKELLYRGADLDDELKEHIAQFLDMARRLLIKEKEAMDAGPVNPVKSGIVEIDSLREKLFGNAKHYGGMFKELIQKIDRTLLNLLRRL